MNPLPITPPATSHPRRRHQGPLDKTWRSLHRHRRRRPPSPSSSATAAIVAITGLVVAWCRLPPPSSSPLSSNAAATLPTTASPPLRLVLLPPCDPLLRCRRTLSIAHGAVMDRHAASTPSGTTRRVPLPPAPPFSKDGTIAPAPPSRPTRCLGLLSGGC